MDGPVIIVVFFVVLGIIVLSVLLNMIPVLLWVSAQAAGVRINISTLIGMRLRRVRPERVIHPLIKARKSGLRITIQELESHLLSGGRVDTVVDSLIAAQRAGLELTFERAAAIDLAGRNVLEAIRMSVTPKVIETPWVSAVAANGIELKVFSRVTVRANLQRLVGGAGEDTVIARVGEGIITTVGSSESHKDVLENPDRISQTVLKKGLDSGTAYEILSIDIADMDIGRNIGANLQLEQAEADKKIAQAKAEERRAIAIAREQEMKAYVVEKQADVVAAEAEIPKAISDALRNGRMGVMDYYNLENKKADTKMREGLSNLNFDVKAHTQIDKQQ